MALNSLSTGDHTRTLGGGDSNVKRVWVLVIPFRG